LKDDEIKRRKYDQSEVNSYQYMWIKKMNVIDLLKPDDNDLNDKGRNAYGISDTELYKWYVDIIKKLFNCKNRTYAGMIHYYMKILMISS